ncbi:putative Barwin domain, RlpA-like domain superfamily protein [Septoria linicola]|nr:putative Barwin domain, RlpA-like domain superfamily protein [Septoria linicola]
MQFTKALIAALSFGAVQAITGDLTYYNAALGACGETHGDNDYVVAIGHDLYDTATVGTNPNNNAYCGKQIKATLPATGKTVTVTVVDRCTGCTNNDLDFAGGAWRDITNDAAPTRFSGLEWNWV